MTEEELRHALGDRVYDAFAPHGLLTQHDAEDPDNLLFIGETDQGEEVEINKRAATSDLLVYVNINLVAMDGGHKSVATGLASYRSLRHHHNPQTMRHSKSFMDQPSLRAALVELAHGTAHRRVGREDLPDRDDAQQRHLPVQFPIPPEARVGMGRARPRHLRRHRGGPVQDAAAARPPDLPLHPLPPRVDLGAGRRGGGGARRDHVERLGPTGRRRRRADRHPHHGASLHLPLQRELHHEPDPGGLPRAGLLLQHVPGQATGARGRRRDHAAPHPARVPSRPSPELHRLLRAGADPDRRPGADAQGVRGVLRHRPVVRPPLPHRPRLPRRAPLLHVVLVRPRAGNIWAG